MNKNGFEIERKFFVRKLPAGLSGCKKQNIIQAYICTSPVMRIRKKGEKYVFTFKGKGSIRRTEFEYPLEREQFNRLLDKTEGRIIEKDRYIIPLENSLICELDIYKGELEGFVNAEVEFSSLSEARSFKPPEWFGREISEDKRYSNASLSQYEDISSLIMDANIDLRKS